MVGEILELSRVFSELFLGRPALLGNNLLTGTHWSEVPAAFRHKNWPLHDHSTLHQGVFTLLSSKKVGKKVFAELKRWPGAKVHSILQLRPSRSRFHQLQQVVVLWAMLQSCSFPKYPKEPQNGRVNILFIFFCPEIFWDMWIARIDHFWRLAPNWISRAACPLAAMSQTVWCQIHCKEHVEILG